VNRSWRNLVLVGLPICLGVAMRVWQWSAQTAMWLDEIWLAQNLRDRGMGGLLFEPLANRQMAPPGFLASVEITTVILGMSEAALRLVPLLASILALLLLWGVARRFLSGAALSAVLLIAAMSPALIWYSGNVKQYSSDVALSLLFVWLGLRYLEEPADLKRAIAAGGMGLVALVSSYAAVLTAFVVGGVVALNHFRARERHAIRPLAVMLGAWAVGAGLAAWAALSFSSPSVREHMRGFWSDGFAPWGEGLIAVGLWIPERLYHTLAHFLVFLDQPFGILAAPLAGLVLIGLPVAWRAHHVRAAILLAPVTGALFGGLVGILPMRHRLAVHAGASIVVISLIGFSALAGKKSRPLGAVAVVWAVIAVMPMPLIVLLQSRPPLRAPDTRAVLESLATRVGAEDTIYAYCYAGPAAEYYGAAAGITRVESLECPASEEELSRRIAAIPSGRVWFLYTDTPEPMWYETAIALLSERGPEVERLNDPHAPPGSSGTAAVLFHIADGA
jgi:hypothetical protein